MEKRWHYTGLRYALTVNFLSIPLKNTLVMNQNYLEVRTKSELEQAIKNGTKKIIVRGDLAEKIHNVEIIKNVSKPALIVLAASLAAMPFTLGTSGAVGLGAASAMTAGLVSLGATAATASAMTATEISVLLAVISFLGLALILGISNGYSMKFTAKADGVGEASMELNKND